MSKKRLITLILSIGIFLSLAATVFAAGQPRRYKENSTVKGTISQSFYSASQGAEWSGNVEFTAEIKKKIIESLKGTLGISYKETRTTNEAVGYKVVHTVPAGKVGHINLYYKGYKIGGRLTVWTANTSNPSQSKRYATYDVNSTLYPSDTLDIFSESYNANI